MAHRDKVAELAEKHGLENPLQDALLRVEAVEFLDEAGKRLVLIEGTPMNCASRLWVQDKALTYGMTFAMTDEFHTDLAEYFAEKWDGDWSSERRPMMHWLATSPYIRAHLRT